MAALTGVSSIGVEGAVPAFDLEMLGVGGLLRFLFPGGIART